MSWKRLVRCQGCECLRAHKWNELVHPQPLCGVRRGPFPGQGRGHTVPCGCRILQHTLFLALFGPVGCSPATRRGLLLLRPSGDESIQVNGIHQSVSERFVK